MNITSFHAIQYGGPAIQPQYGATGPVDGRPSRWLGRARDADRQSAHRRRGRRELAFLVRQYATKPPQRNLALQVSDAVESVCSPKRWHRAEERCTRVAREFWGGAEQAYVWFTAKAGFAPRQPGAENLGVRSGDAARGRCIQRRSQAQVSAPDSPATLKHGWRARAEQQDGVVNGAGCGFTALPPSPCCYSGVGMAMASRRDSDEP